MRQKFRKRIILTASSALKKLYRRHLGEYFGLLFMAAYMQHTMIKYESFFAVLNHSYLKFDRY